MPITITKEQYSDMRDDSEGICLNCREVAYGVEPDATNYECEDCGADEVFGIEELLIMGEINFVDEEE